MAAMKVKRRTWFIGGAIAVIVAGVIIGVMLTRPHGSSTLSSGRQATFKVVRGDIVQTLTVYGDVVPKRVYTFTFAGDRVNEILVNVGQRVEPGQILVELDSTQQELSLLQAERALQDAQAEGVPATIHEKELSYTIAQKNYEDATLHAPFAGVIAQITQPTTSSENWSLTLNDTSDLYIEANVDQLDAPDISVGQTAHATIEPLSGRTWPVEIVEVGGMAVSRGNSTVVVVRGKLPEADPSILVGYSAEMVITTAQATDVLRVPISALIQGPRGWTVRKLVDGEPTIQQVTIGVTSDTFAEITSGLEEGDIVLLNSAASETTGSEQDRGEQPQFFFQGTPGGGFPGGPGF